MTWVARFQYYTPEGKRLEKTRHATTKAEACELLAELEREYGGATNVSHHGGTFADLAAFYCSTYAVPPTIIEDREVAGLVSWKTVRQIVNDALVPYFGQMRVSAITFGDIRQFKNQRFAVPTKNGKQRSVRRVNHELSTLRRMLNVAVDEGWIAANPMVGGRSKRDPLIRTRDENHRERVLSYDEEERLLAACTGKRSHLRPVLILALDTGMRRGEIQKMRWRDVDLIRGVIQVPAKNAKSRKARAVPITPRLSSELHALRPIPEDPDALIFPFDWKTAFNAARKAAGIGSDFVFHSTRHTAATRLAAAGIGAFEVAAIVGHSAPTMTMSYVHSTPESLARAAAALDQQQRNSTVGNVETGRDAA